MTEKFSLPSSTHLKQKNTENCARNITSTMRNFVKQLKVLEPPLDKRFVEIMDEQLDTLPLEMPEMFIDGFRLGARMMIEIYQKDFTDTCE